MNGRAVTFTINGDALATASRELASSQVAAVEALVRWTRGGDPVPPAEFLGIAEDCGLILPLGDWVLREACRQQDALTLASIGSHSALDVAYGASAYGLRNLSPALREAVKRCLADKDPIVR